MGESMRVLVATTAGPGHFSALQPFATALRDAGHDVKVAAPASFSPAVQRAGFNHIVLADAPPEEIGPVFARLPHLSMEEANAVVFRDIFCGIDARAALPAMQAAVDRWRPDVILREPAEFSSYVVASRTGIPHVQLALSLASGAMEEFMLPLVEEPLRILGAVGGVEGLLAEPIFSTVPPSIESTDQPAARPIYRFRHMERAASQAGLPTEWWDDSSAPLVYMTFGSVAAAIGFFPDFYRGALEALADLPVLVLLTVGEAGDPEQIQPIPRNAHVERWWPQEEVMAGCSAMVTHGGFGTTLLGLAAGVPMVMLPLFAIDQFANAGAVEAAEAGIALQGGPAALQALRSALQQVLSDGSHRIAARRLADEIARLPAPQQCIPILEALARGDEPVFRPVHPDTGSLEA